MPYDTADCPICNGTGRVQVVTDTHDSDDNPHLVWDGKDRVRLLAPEDGYGEVSDQ